MTEKTSESSAVTEGKRGTESYRAPELIVGGKYSTKVDIFALGCILYELVCCRKAFATDYELVVYSQSRTPPEVPWGPNINERWKSILSNVLLQILSIEKAKCPSASELWRQFKTYCTISYAEFCLVKGDTKASFKVFAKAVTD